MSATGIGVHGEEFGGADVDSPLVWVLDPIDGTFNYAAGSADGGDPAGPAARRRAGARADLAAVHRSALHRGRRKAAVRQRCCAAAAGAGRRWPTRIVGIGTFNIDSRGAFPGPLPGRDAGEAEPEVLADADARRHRHRPRLRRRRNPRWRNQFRPSRLGSRGRGGAGAGRGRHRHRPGGRAVDDRRRESALAGVPGVHGEMLEIVRSVGRPGGLPDEPQTTSRSG